MIRKLKIALITLVILVVAASIAFVSVLSIYAAPWLFLAFYAWTSPEPPEPEVTYGEFPFKLVYEIDGEVITIEDTIIIEYAGVGPAPGGLTKEHKWKWDYMSEIGDDGKPFDNSCLTICKGFHPNGDSYSISFKLGSVAYYMGLPENEWFYKSYAKPGDIYMSSRNNSHVVSEEELYEKYGIRIIEKRISPPISSQE